MAMGRYGRTIGTLALPATLPVERLQGRLRGSGQPLVLTYAGESATADFIAGALLDLERRTRVGRLASPLHLRSESFRKLCSDSDLVAMDVPRLWQGCLPSGTHIRMPAWVSQQIGDDGGSPVVVPPRIRKEVRRHSRREGYELRFSTGAGDLRRFYAELYRPYLSARFGAGAVIVDEARFLAASRGMTLALLTAAGQWVAGVLLDQGGHTLRLGWFGSRCAPPPAGASEVLDAGVLEWAAAQRVTRVVMGHSRPSLADGVVRYKSRFGAQVRATRFPQRTLGLWVLRWSPALKASLDAARFVTFRNGQPSIYVAPPVVPVG